MHSKVILILFLISGGLISPSTLANDPQKQMDLQVARELIGPRGLFFQSRPFLSQFTLGIAQGETDKERSEAFIESIINSPQTDRKMRSLRKALLKDKFVGDGFYRERLTVQLELAYKHGSSLYHALKYINQTEENHKLNIRYQRSQSKDLSFVFGTLTNIGIMVGNTMLGGPTSFTTAWPIIGLGPMMVAWRFSLAYPLARHSRKPLTWARTNLKDHTASMGEVITDTLGLPRFPRPKESLLTRAKQKLSSPIKSFTEYLQNPGQGTQKERPMIEVVQLATHPDGSPLVVTRDNLMASLHFRNSLPIYKGRTSQIIHKGSLVLYPSAEIKTTNGMQTVLKGANLHNQILIPEVYRAASTEDPLQKIETLKNALTLLLESSSLNLPQKLNSPRTHPSCLALLEVGSGG